MENCCLTHATNVYDWWIVMTICGSIVFLAIIFAISFRRRISKERQMITFASEELNKIVTNLKEDQTTCLENAQLLSGEAERLKKTCDNLDILSKKLEKSIKPHDDEQKQVTE